MGIPISMTEQDIDHLHYAIKQLTELNNHTTYVGAFIVAGDESVEMLQMILGVQETGATIKPVNAKYLTIPTKYAGRLKARQIPGLFFYITKSKGQPALAKVDNGQLHVYFLLADQVVIPSRPVLQTTVDECAKTIASVAADKVVDILNGKGEWRDVCNAVGMLVSSTLKTNISQWSTPPNAEITASRKGFNNPLVDTGQLENSISWVVV